MASFEDHILQAKKNLSFLKEINSKLSEQYWDWNVTVCFYSAVHLVNSHLAAKADAHYRRHDEVDKHINPEIQLSPTKVPENVYLAYKKLQNLSRRSRYLISENMTNRSERANLTYDRHYKKALGYLDIWLDYVRETYNENFDKTSVDCIEARGIGLKFFVVM